MSNNQADALTTRFTEPRPELAVGTAHQGFTVTAVETVAELPGTAYIMRHDATQARLMWLAADDPNRSFAIAFKTPPADDTGVFHILEHSVLCGSDRYPVKEPFVHLLKNSMQTFLNALTFSDKTMYPVSSTNVNDLENLMDIYLDAVLHPAVYQRPRIFEQEGWHYETEGLDAPLTYNGVVFNEMKGALSSPEDFALMHLNRLVFPDSPYGFESGGNPRSIPQLTYEAFLDNHARHYNLPNSYTILYGDLDIERELAFVGAHFDEACLRDAGAPNPLPLQQPTSSPLKRVSMATDPKNALVMVSYVIGTSADRELMLATDALIDALAGSNEAPLKRAVLDADLGDDFSMLLNDGVLQPQVIFMLKGAKPGAAERFMELVEKTCADLARDGIERERLRASLAQMEFNLRENDNGGTASDGIYLSIRALSGWLYDDSRAVDYLRYEDELKHMTDGVDQGYFEKLLKRIVCTNGHHGAIEIVPVEEGDSAEEAAELEAARAAMSTEQVEHIMSEVAALREEQERPDAPEDVAKLPRLTIDEIGDAPSETPARMVEAPLPCYYHNLETHRIVYAYQYFDLRRLSYEDLPYVGLLTSLLSRVDTERLSAARLDTELESNLGDLSFFSEVYERDDDPTYARPMLVVGASALSEKIDALAKLPAEVWSTSRFDDLDRIHDVIQQRRVALEQRFLNAGHSSAAARLSTYFSGASLVSSNFSGIEHYLFVKDLLNRWDECSPQLPEKLSSLAKRIFSANEVLVSLTCSPEDLERYWDAAGNLGLPTLDDAQCAHRLVAPPTQVKNEAFIIPSNICFVAEGQDKSAHDPRTNGHWTVATRALTYDYLWNEVRVKGGAYGTGFRHTNPGYTQFWSYRDPGIDATVRRFEGASDWLAKWDPSDEDLTGYIVSSVATHDTPCKSLQLARRQDSLYLAQRPSGWRDEMRRQILSTTTEAVRGLSNTLSELPERRAFCIFGGREQIEASELDLNVIDLLA
ncbi:MAG: insulinase family protein [Atopobiaceae bacterium]|nr:insulinase family protein [Atopobiaceae bacterium]